MIPPSCMVSVYRYHIVGSYSIRERGCSLLMMIITSCMSYSSRAGAESTSCPSRRDQKCSHMQRRLRGLEVKKSLYIAISTSRTCVWVSRFQKALPPIALYIPTCSKHRQSKHCPANYEHSFFFLPHPIKHLIRSLRKSSPTRRRRRYTIQLEKRRHPRQRDVGHARLVVDLERRWFGVHVCV